MDYRTVRQRPPRGSTAWGAQQFLRVLDEEERVAAERERLLAIGWRPPHRPNGEPHDQFFGQESNALVDRLEQDRRNLQAVEEEARRRARIRFTQGASGDTAPIHPGRTAEAMPDWVGSGRFGALVPPPPAIGTSNPTTTQFDGAAPTLQHVGMTQPNFANLVAAYSAVTLALITTQNFKPTTLEEAEWQQRREADLLFQYRRLTHQMAQQLSPEQMAKLEEAARLRFDALPAEPPAPPRDFDPEEMRKLRREFGGPSTNIPPVIDESPESNPIEDSDIPTTFSGPDPSNPPQFPTWTEHRGSSATQWKTTEYARRTVELGRENEQELEHSHGGYDESGQPKGEEWYRNDQAAGATRWSNFVDSTIRDKRTGRRILLQTIDTDADGLTPSAREWRSNIRLMYNKRSGDYLVLIPKSVPLDEVDWDAFDRAMRPIVREIGRPMNHGQSQRVLDPDKEWTTINVRPMIN